MSTKKFTPISNLQKLSLASITSFLNRKQLEIITILLTITLTCVLVSVQMLKPTTFIRKISFNYGAKNINPRSNTSDNSLHLNLKNILNCSDNALKRETLLYGDYWLLKNYIRGRKSINMGCAESVTYAINGDFKMMKNLPVLVERYVINIFKLSI